MFQVTDSFVTPLARRGVSRRGVKSPRDDGASDEQIVEQLRTVYWAHDVQLHLGVRTAYAIEKLVEPEGFRRNAFGETVRRNKWSKYKRGVRCPSTATLKAADRCAPGSIAVYKNVFWHVISVSTSASRDLDAVLAALNPSIQATCRDIVAARVAAPHDRWRPNGMRLGFLLRRLDLDVLAFLTVLLLLCHEEGRKVALEEVRHVLYEALLIYSFEFVERGVAEQLYKHYLHHLLCLGCEDGTRRLFLPMTFCDAQGLLSAMLSNTRRNASPGLTSKERHQILRKILRGDYGLDWAYVFRLVHVPNLSSSRLNKVQMFQLYRDLLFRADALYGTMFRDERSDPFEAIQRPVPKETWETLGERGQELALALAKGRIAT